MLPEIVRCPYCVEGGCFRPMLQRAPGWFLCLGCGHSAIPADPHARCACDKCHAMGELASRCKNSEDLRRYDEVGY